MNSLLCMNGINKRYNHVQANKDVTLEVHAREIHAVVGENGAGKSTLMKILYGMEQMDSGQIILNGKEVKIRSPKDAIVLGIGMVHQDFMLVPSFTVAQNIILGNEPKDRFLLDNDGINAKINKLSQDYKLKVDARAKVSNLAVGVQQRVEILKALYRGVKLLILDEPTAVLTPQETAELFDTMRRFTDSGYTILFITHKLEELMQVSDRITVMRNGQVIGERLTKDTNKAEIARMMVGRDVLLEVDKGKTEPGCCVLAVEGLRFEKAGREVLKGIDFTVRKGEILGIAGVQGNGQKELIEILSGKVRAKSGKITLKETDIVKATTGILRRMGVAHIPENRDSTGLCLSYTVAENAILPQLDNFTKRGFLKPIEIRSFASDLIKEYDVKTGDINSPASSMSGGNKQKLIVAREVATKPILLLANQPTRGVDVGATEYIHAKLIKLRDEGLAIVLISTDLEEIMGLSDRVIVIYEGTIVGEVVPGKVTEEQIGLLMAGIKSEGGKL